MPRNRIGRLLTASVMALSLTSGIGAGALLTSAPASATACGTPIAAGSNCTMTGTLTVTAGTLTLTSPASLTWAATLNGTNQNVVDTVAGDQQLTVNDATGSGAGWHVQTSATTFTNGTHTLPNSGTFSITGSVSSASSTNAPSATCVATCTLPTNTSTYPVAVTTAASSPPLTTIYDTSASTGIGQVILGGSANANPLGWWVVVPANAFSGSYTSTITMQIVSGP